MLRIIVNRTPAGAKSYYATADYYAEEQPGIWRGKGAEQLGLAGAIDKEDWEALCDNRDPAGGKTLTARQKEGRRVGYDLNFHAPKSLSLLYALTGDERLADAFRDAVDATMQDMESEVLTRVRSGGRNESRETGNLVWGEYLHSTARPVGGVPDPHLHIHALAFNATWDAQEQRWKAADFSGLKRDAPYFEALFHSRLSRNLAELGLPIERTRHGWELAGVAEVARNKFSRRTAEIEQAAREQGITDGADKDQLGARTREAKATRYTPAQLRSMWRERLDDGERAELDRLAGRIGGDAIPEDDARPTEAVSLALSHVFERRSVVPERTLRAEALKR
ncbi:MAG: MobF family relaxase, partial [Planctomycetota bacterium]